MRRGDMIPIDSRSHLEVADRNHRYAKNLRLYFKEYHRLHGDADIVEPTSSSRKWTRYDPFFQWLDGSERLPEVHLCNA
ncbi:hypothetical protein B484DRAFT_277571 [Ochromonadaceae sp. CCMP2298]|nr:hypothetical protein B484DRAFT_277571 [Ochromonadaceae sp. CCMP2298]